LLLVEGQLQSHGASQGNAGDSHRGANCPQDLMDIIGQDLYGNSAPGVSCAAEAAQVWSQDAKSGLDKRGDLITPS
jgi:hypothetical protein